MALVSGASGAGPFRLNPAGAQGAVTVKEDGSLKQTVPAAWARWITDGAPRRFQAEVTERAAIIVSYSN
jgi:hypothetical protein